METKEAAVSAKKLRDRGRRLWKNYHWTNEMYDALFALQGGVCAGCGRPPKNAPLNLDHFHFRIDTVRTSRGEWRASTAFGGMVFESWRKTKAEAMECVRDAALPYSVRGLLCPGRYRGCNRLLGRVDNIAWLERILVYLKDPPAKKVLTKP